MIEKGVVLDGWVSIARMRVVAREALNGRRRTQNQSDRMVLLAAFHTLDALLADFPELTQLKACKDLLEMIKSKIDFAAALLELDRPAN